MTYDSTINHTLEDADGNTFPCEISYNRLQGPVMFFAEETKVLVTDLKVKADKLTAEDMPEIIQVIKDFEYPYQVITE